MKRLLTIATVAMLATVACDKKTDGPNVPVDAPKATIVAAPTSVGVGENGAFNVTLDKTAEADILIAVANENENALTIAAKEIKITKGSQAGAVTFIGKAEGSAKVTFTSQTANIQTKELTVTVTKAGEKPFEKKEYSYPTSGWGTYGGLISAAVGSVKIDCGTEFADDSGQGTYFNKYVNSPVVPVATGNKLTVEFSTDAVYDGTEISSGKTYWIDVYADWNNDGTFGADEQIGKKDVVGDDSKQSVEFTITVPETAAKNSIIRIVYAFNGQNEETYIPHEYMDSGAILEFVYSK